MYITDLVIDLMDFLEKDPPESCGGTVLFVGRVRNHHEGRPVCRLFYESYRSMAEKQIRKILDEVKAETGVFEIRVVHRIGWLEIGDIAVAISASGAHREEAFQACREMIERIKRDVPIWKKEVYQNETQRWVTCQ